MRFADPSHLRDDVLASLSTAVISLPGNIIFGMIAFAPLGAAYAGMGVLSGWICSIVLGGFSALFSNTSGLISGPRAGVALAIAAFLGHLLGAGEAYPVPYLLSLLFILLLTAGVIQMFLGLLKVGIIIKYISYPVIVGMINSKVLLLLRSQIWNSIGVEQDGAFFAALSRLNPFAVLLTFLTVFSFFVLKKFIRRFPVHIFVILLGCLIHQLLIRTGIAADPGRTLDVFTTGYVNLFYRHASADIFRNGLLTAYLPDILISAVSVAVLSSTDTLMTSLAIQNVTYESVDANRELVVQGVGNVLAVFAGGMVGGGSSTRSMANVQAGGRHKVAALLSVLILLGIATVLQPLIKYIPLSVIAGLVVIIAVNMFDPWFFGLFRRIRSQRTGANTAVLGNLAIVLIIMVITFAASLIYAILIGIAISFFLYVHRKSKLSLLRRIYTGASIRSKTQRPSDAMEILSAHGGEIFIAELEGSLFFGTADELSAQADQLIQRGGRYIILDLKRISDIDSSGVKILERLFAKSREKGCRIFLSYLSESSPLWSELQGLGIFRVLERDSCFPDSDSALEHCEDLVLKKYRYGFSAEDTVRFDAFRGFSEEDFRVLNGLLIRKRYLGGEFICRQGDHSRSIFFIASGSAVITINLQKNKGEKRLETLRAGTTFGEMGVLEGKPRSANVRAKGETDCLILDKGKFDDMRSNHEETYMKMMNNLLKTLSSRLRYANIAISALES